MSSKGHHLQRQNIAKDLMMDLRGRNHIATTEIFFTSIPLFLDLLNDGIMATGTLKSDRKYLPKAMFVKSATKKKQMGWLDYYMYELGKICCAVWKDKRDVLLLSTHAKPNFPLEIKQYVLLRVESVKKRVTLGPIYLQNTKI